MGYSDILRWLHPALRSHHDHAGGVYARLYKQGEKVVALPWWQTVLSGESIAPDSDFDSSVHVAWLAVHSEQAM